MTDRVSLGDGFSRAAPPWENSPTAYSYNTLCLGFDQANLSLSIYASLNFFAHRTVAKQNRPSLLTLRSCAILFASSSVKKPKDKESRMP